MRKFTFFWVLFAFVSLNALAQDPAVTSRSLSPAPIPLVAGNPDSYTFTLGFRFGNFGAAPISGVGAENKMQFVINFSDSRPRPQSTEALSVTANSGGSTIFDWFDITYNSADNTFEGIQKEGVSIGAASVALLYITTEVTTATATASNNTIGGRITIIPNSSAVGQPTANDVASIYTHTSQVVMPVSLVSFTAQAQEDRTALIQWKTSWESSNKGYIVERSKDLLTFEQVGEVNDVAGTSNSITEYRYVDTNPYKGRSYYRLRQLDLDGTSHTYKAEAIEIDGRYGVYPNPIASSHFILELDEPSTSLLRMYGPSGKEVKLNKSEINETSLKVTTDTKLSAGVYVLTVEERGTTRKHRLVIL